MENRTKAFCVLASSVVLAEGSSVVYATKMKTPENNVSVNVSESNISETVKYIDGKRQRSLDPKSEKDMEELANSVEFEVYKFNESASSKTTFLSPAGICSGFKSDDGVDVTNTKSCSAKDLPMALPSANRKVLAMPPPTNICPCSPLIIKTSFAPVSIRLLTLPRTMFSLLMTVMPTKSAQ